ncbi:ABC transporter permease [Streptomyces radicis]|uniref:ABC transporter permease n=1 Tax=Streptomyces radicis TaxID=1750517 RepID=A0A3A9WKJ5_9ACTN|nr:ABC transporter permease [Streptomyces radicis]RKN12813.1 ABC transporter permease [Streptomyces radicis]RKN27422.1 ABC transporter permease [Streptomyces radicis]
MSLTSAPTEEAVAGAPAPVAPGRAARRGPRLGVNPRGFAFALGLLVVIELLTATLVTSAYVPRPSEVGSALLSEIGEGDILSGLGDTLWAYLQGLGIAAGLGVILGAALGASNVAYQTFRVVIEFLRPLPSVALIPFSILLLGVGSTTTVAMIAYASFWPILFNTYYGVRGVHATSVETARSFGVGGLGVFFRVQIPSAATSVAAGVRISASIALILVITVEMLTRSGGLGHYIVRMQVAIRTEEMYAGIFLVGLIGYLISLVVGHLERRVVFWNVDSREDGGR